MSALSPLLVGLAQVLDLALTIYMWVIIARALISWVNPDPYNPIVRFLYKVTEPVLAWLRQRLPLVYGGLDLTPLLVLLAIIILRNYLNYMILHLAYRSF